MKDKIKEMDLHLHTYYSDGSLSPEQVIEYVFLQGKKLVAITDHDGTGGVREAVKAGEKRGIEVITGIEFSTVTETGLRLHILGYHIDVENRPLKEALEDIRKKRQERNEKLIKELRNLGFALSEEDLSLGQEQGFIGKPVFARALANSGYIKEPKEAFGPAGIFNLPQIRSIRKETISTQKAIELIHGAGGKAVLAHPGKIKNMKCVNHREKEAPRGSAEFYKAADELVRNLIKKGLDGLECYHKDHSKEEAEQFVAIAKKYQICITKGSDYHGPDFE